MKIGVTLPQAYMAGAIPRYREIRNAALKAEADGFDSLWVMDHLLFRRDDEPPAGVWEAMTLLAAVAEATERVELGALVLCTAFRNPALLAKMISALDEVSDGRVILGVGAGWHEPEFEAFGYPFDHLASRFEEAMAILLPLLREGKVDFVGKYERAPDCLNVPRGPRLAGPPLLMGTQGPRLIRLAAREADAWNACWLGRASDLPDRLAPFHAACADVGRDLDSIEVTVGALATFREVADQVVYPGGPERFTYEDPEDLANEWRKYEEMGVKHLMVWFLPEGERTANLLAEALRLYRGSGS
ncbi:MAG: LLM class flavin-dependent oxidoreductase [Thermomicrobiales bacterium]|nr:LLM class flavin-dependent oxidoreductase [Thermomicrobiales bacterium]